MLINRRRKLCIVAVFVILTTVKYIYRPAQSSECCQLHQILIIVRTTPPNYSDRLSGLVSTWFKFAKDVHVITDQHDSNPEFMKESSLVKNWHVSSCPIERSLRSLCCKTAMEFGLMKKERFSSAKWLCRFDDDQYVNVPRLVSHLSNLGHTEDVYLGRPSVKFIERSRPVKTKFEFHTFGAGVCYSKHLLERLFPHTTPADTFINGCVQWQLPDDMYVGKLVTVDLNVRPMISTLFHSHLHFMDNLTNILNKGSFSDLSQIISFGFKEKTRNQLGLIHCVLFPSDKGCQEKIWTSLQQKD